MENKMRDSRQYALPTRNEVRIGNTTFTVNSYFPESATDTVKDKVERLIKDELRKSFSEK